MYETTWALEYCEGGAGHPSTWAWILEAPGSEAWLAERIRVLASFKRGDMPPFYLCPSSWRSEPLPPAPACDLSACQIPSAACDGQSNTPYLATSQTDVPRLLDPFSAQENPHPQSKEAGRRKQITEKEHFGGPAQRSRWFFQSGERGEQALSPSASSVTRSVRCGRSELESRTWKSLNSLHAE